MNRFFFLADLPKLYFIHEYACLRSSVGRKYERRCICHLKFLIYDLIFDFDIAHGCSFFFANLNNGRSSLKRNEKKEGNFSRSSPFKAVFFFKATSRENWSAKGTGVYIQSNNRQQKFRLSFCSLFWVSCLFGFFSWFFAYFIRIFSSYEFCMKWGNLF